MVTTRSYREVTDDPAAGRSVRKRCDAMRPATVAAIVFIMSHVAVAAHALEHVAAGLVGEHVLDEVTVAVETGILHDAGVARLDLDRFVGLVGGERQRMEEAVDGLDEPLAREAVGEVAVVAGGDVVVAGFDPRVEVVLHDVAISAGVGIVGETGRAFAIAEGKKTNAAEHPQDRCGGEGQP
jgi:hypothetical protein